MVTKKSPLVSNVDDENLFNLPLLPTNEMNKNVNSKMLCPNNSSYIDGLFSFLSGELIHSYNFINGVEYYGSYLGIKKNYKCNITDDIDYISQNSFFKKYINSLFTLDAKYMTNESYFKSPIKINHESNMSNALSLKSIKDELFEDVFDKSESEIQTNENFNELTEITSKNLIIHNKDTYMNTIRSGSSFSSRTTNTTENDNVETEDWNDEIDNLDYDKTGSTNDRNINTENEKDAETESTTEISDIGSEDNTESTSGGDESDDSSEEEEEEEEEIFIDVHQFPVQLICMEKCDDTFDNLHYGSELEEEEYEYSDTE